MRSMRRRFVFNGIMTWWCYSNIDIADRMLHRFRLLLQAPHK
jgi:hypothetical protein